MNHAYPSVKDAIDIHDALIDKLGGASGIISEAALDAAINRPQSGYYGSIIEEAAALMESIANNHPFVDGNKRTSFAVCDTFLKMNGYYIHCDNVEAYETLINMFETDSFNFSKLCAWLEEKVKPQPIA